MKTTVKKTLISMFAMIAIAAVPVGLVAMDNMQASAETITAPESVFYMEEGAAVRTDTDKLGIRFSATITKAYWEDLQTTYGVDATYKFYSVVTDGVMPVTKDYGTLTPDFTDTDEYTFYSTIVYDTAELKEAGLLEESCELELSAQTYVDITKVGEETPTTLAAYGETGVRSMKAVANAAVLAGEEDEDLLNYFAVGNRSELQEGYVFDDNGGFITMANLPDLTDATDMGVYYGAQKVEATYENGTISFNGVELEAGQTSAYISVFTGGKVYSSKISKAKKITQANVTDLLSVANETIYLAEDIDLAGIEWNSTASFSGVFDGGNHAIKNLTTVTDNGFFANVQGTIKNVAFVDAYTGGNSAVIANKPTGTLSLENVFIDLSGRGGWSGATLYTSASAEFAANMTNVVVNFPAAQTNYNLFGYILKGTSTLTNVHVISGSGVYARMNDASKVYVKAGSTVSFHTDLSAFATAEMTLTPFLNECVEDYLNIVKISQANAADLLTLKGNETVILTEDVDLAGIEWNSTASFSGVFDGNNHAIKNLTTVAGNGFFKDINGATIRNVAFVDVTLPSSSGVITYRPTGALVMENTFIEVTSTGAGGRLGAICERSNNAVALNLTNVVISMPGTNANEAIYGYSLKGSSKLTNVHCIGLANKTASVANASPVIASGSTYTFHTDLSAFATANTSLTPFLNECVEEYLNIVKISQSNANKLLSLKGNAMVILTEDVDLAGIEWNSTTSFSGVFDGNNHAIKNLTTVAGNGFFKDINGATIRNVAFVDVTLPSNSGVITYRPTGALVMENTFIEVIWTGSGGRLGAICERSNNAVALNLTNVVISMPGTNANEAIYGYSLKGSSKLTNVHCIGLANKTASVANASPVIASGSTYTFHTDLSAFNSANPTLTEFLTSCVTTYLNANANA